MAMDCDAVAISFVSHPPPKTAFIRSVITHHEPPEAIDHCKPPVSKNTSQNRVQERENIRGRSITVHQIALIQAERAKPRTGDLDAFLVLIERDEVVFPHLIVRPLLLILLLLAIDNLLQDLGVRVRLDERTLTHAFRVAMRVRSVDYYVVDGLDGRVRGCGEVGDRGVQSARDAMAGLALASFGDLHRVWAFPCRDGIQFSGRHDVLCVLCSVWCRRGERRNWGFSLEMERKGFVEGTTPEARVGVGAVLRRKEQEREWEKIR